MEMIKVTELVKSYGDVLAVDKVSFSVNKGEIVGLLGPNGAGKTTIMRIMTGYFSGCSGSVEIAGQSVWPGSLETRTKIGYLPENCPLYHEMNVLEYLSFIAQMRGIPASKSKDRIFSTSAECGLEPVMYRNIYALSKGFRQRVGLASTLLHDPQILILDEPTSGLDPRQIIEIRELIKKMGQEKTVILSSHILPEVSATCQKVIIINKGRIVAQGPTIEIADSLSGRNKISVLFRAGAGEVFAGLSALPFVTKVEPNEQGTAGLTSFVVHTDGTERPTEQIFDFAVKHGFTISELKRETPSLEEIFIELTSGDEK